MLPHMHTTSAPQPLPLVLQLEHSPQLLQPKLSFQRPTLHQSQELSPLLLLVRLQQRPPTSLGEQQSGIKAVCHYNARQPVTEQTLAPSSLQWKLAQVSHSEQVSTISETRQPTKLPNQPKQLTSALPWLIMAQQLSFPQSQQLHIQFQLSSSDD